MLKNKSVIILVAMAIILMMSVTVFATETEPKVYDKEETVVLDNIDISANGCDGAIYVGSKANVTINSGKVNGLLCGHETHKDGYQYSMAVWVDGGTLTINGGVFTNELDPKYPTQSDMIYVKNGGKIVINGGEFKCATPGWTLNASNEYPGQIIVRGGRFYDFNPLTANTTEGFRDGNGLGGKNEVIVEEGYTVVKDGDWYEVKKIETSKVYKGVTKTITLDGTISENGCWGAIQAWDNANLTINGNGNVHGEVCDGRVVGLDGCKGCGASTTIGVYDNSTVVINGGNYTNEADTISDDQYHVDLIYVKNGGKVIINGGTFKCATPGWTLNAKNDSPGKIIVQGGRFYKFNPLTANTTEGFGDGVDPKGNNEVEVAKGYTVVKDGDWYEVVCAHTENLTKKDAVEPTYTTEGSWEYYVCSCGTWLDADKKVIENKENVVRPMLIQIGNNNAAMDDVVVEDSIKDSGNSSAVELPAVENATSVTVKVESLDKVVEADKGLTVETKDTIVTLDAKAVEEVAKQAENATSITIEVTKTEEKTLNKEQKEAIKDKEVAVVISATILADGKEISDFKGGKVKVEIPFTPAEGTKGSDYKVYYIADDGKVTAVPTRYVKGNLVVELEHFSEYVVVKEVATAAPAPSAPAAAANPNEKDNTPKTGAISVIGLVIAMSVVGLAVLKRD